MYMFVCLNQLECVCCSFVGCRITALGAAGGTGVYNTERGLGAYASAKFTFNASDLIYVIVGQQGTDACASADRV